MRSEVYDQILSGEAFDLLVISCDRKRGTGGKIITLEGWIVMRDDSKQMADDSKEPSSVSYHPSSTPKDPHHAENGTLNVFNPANSGVHPVSIHLDLIQFFNGKRVIN